ncbi:hypothetical protein [Rugamonas sp.]|uniref:hypothetical protein n=1 Tax=Rugamonas sp. TaxID=1926287 RepID=UPI0025D0CC7D|nr:hypothetical protein [Rugamonas sp.]
MTTTVIANGDTYTDDDDPSTGMGNGGFQTRLLPMLSDVMHDVNIGLIASQGAAASSTAAAAAAATALSAPGTSASSTTSAPIATGSVTLNVQTGKSFAVGASVKAAITASASNWMFGDITAYNSTTGDLTISVTMTQGSGTSAAWTVSVSGPAYVPGSLGGSYTSGMSANLVLTNASPHLLSLDPGLSGLAVVEPDATTLLVGPYQQQIKNNGSSGYDIQIQNKTGANLGFLQPFTTALVGLLDNSTLAGSWAVSGLQPVGTLALGSVTLASACGGSGGTWIRAITLDSTHTLLLIYGTSLHAVVYDAGANTFGAPVLLRATLSTTGVDATVAGVLVSSGKVLVQSIQDGTTALQSVVLTITSGTTITPGGVVSTTLGATCARIVEQIVVGSTYVLGYMNGTTSIRTIAATVSGTTPTLGAEQANTTVGPPALIVWSATTFAVVTISATALTAKGFSVSGSAQSPGSSASTACTTTDSFSMAQLWATVWGIVCINTTAVGVSLTMTGTLPAFSAQVALSTAVTTISAGGVVSAGNYNVAFSASPIYTATSGTDSNGRFITEFSAFSDTGSGPSIYSTGNIIKGFTAAPTAVPIACSNAFRRMYWQVTSATGTLLLYISALTWVILGQCRTNAVANYAQPLSSADPLYPKVQTARNNLGSYATTPRTSFAGMTDGSKLSVHYGAEPASYVELLNKPIALVGDMRHCCKGTDDTNAWLAFNQAPEMSVAIQRVGIV